MKITAGAVTLVLVCVFPLYLAQYAGYLDDRYHKNIPVGLPPNPFPYGDELLEPQDFVDGNAVEESETHKPPPHHELEHRHMHGNSPARLRGMLYLVVSGNDDDEDNSDENNQQENFIAQDSLSNVLGQGVENVQRSKALDG